MSYRDENVGIEVQKARFEEAKATLEELADKDISIVFTFPKGFPTQFNSAITELGFRKEKLGEHRSVYVRENETGTELLAYCSFTNYDPRLHLYKVPKDQDIQSWYKEMFSSSKFTKYEKKIVSVAASAVAVAGVGMFTAISLNNYFSIILTLGAAVIAYFGSERIIGPTAEEQTIAKGSDTLRYIKNNTAYKAPRLRKVRVIDAEFNEEVEKEHQASLEALAIEQQVQEEKQVMRAK